MKNKIYYTYKEMHADLINLVKALMVRQLNSGIRVNKIYGLPRGGLIPAVILSHLIELPIILNKDEIDDQTLIIDDIIDTGETIKRLEKKGGIIVSLYKDENSEYTPDIFMKLKESNDWIVFPFETEQSSKYDYTEL